MSASIQEELKDASFADDLPSSIEFQERVFSQGVKLAFGRLLDKIFYKKNNSNTFGAALRLFKLPFSHTIGFPSIDTMRTSYGKVVQALYIFKLHLPHKDGFTHGIHLRLNGFVHRKLLEKALEELVITFAGQPIELKAYVPVINKNVSLCDYLQSLYVIPKNLYVNFSHHSDAVSAAWPLQQSDANKQDAELKNKMIVLASSILDTMVSIPSKYPNSYLSCILKMSGIEFRRHMRQTNIQEVVTKVGQDAYNCALQDKRLKSREVQDLMEPMTRRSMLNRCIGDKITKHIQQLLQQTHGNVFVHPHPYNGIFSSDLVSHRALDGIIFDPRFLFSMLLVSRWFLKSCMLEENSSSNNHAHLLLYGGAGTGKSLLASVIASAVPTYKYLVNSRFQNPEMLQASVLTIEEFDVSHLPCNSYKALLDLKTHVKVDFKNLHPENVTEGVPSIITTNDEIYSVLNAQKKYPKSSVDAALRRLYIVPMKAGSFERLHGRISSDSPSYELAGIYDAKFDKEQTRLPRMFNLLMSYALFQQDVTGVYCDTRLVPYFEKLIKDFKCTVFGTFYLTQKAKVDELVKEVESLMEEPDQSDSQYLMGVSSCIGRFQQLLLQYLSILIEKGTDLKYSVLKDKTVPWPLKGYYLLSSYKLSVKLMWEVDDPFEFLNPEVQAFLKNPGHQLFTPEVYQAYQDLREPFDSSSEENQLFNMDIPCNQSFTSMKQPAPCEDLDIDSLLEGSKKRTVSERFGIEQIMYQDQESL